MDHFENLLKTLLEQEGYWVRQSFKVNLTKDEKSKIGKPSLPRPEIDILAFKPNLQQVLVLEAKSYLDSQGVRLNKLREESKKPEGRYKLFTCANYRKIVFGRLRKDLKKQGMVHGKIQMKLGLVAGNIYQDRSEEIRKHLESSGWFFWSPEDIQGKVEKLAEAGYENELSIITAKILLRKPAKMSRQE